ncbi:MAG: hypothetical protein H7301_10385 [Cryobacterium sp.]|nr:hypothetical protein [Oligoflexia bacterium]
MLNKTNGTDAPVFANIPISAEFNQTTGELVSCTLHPEDLDESMGAGSVHTVRECLQIDGAPMPTDQGMICRVPYSTFNNRWTNGSIPNCPAGWTNVTTTGRYNTTVPTDDTYDSCGGEIKKLRNGIRCLRTRWSSKNLTLKKGSQDGRWWAAGGATFTIIALAGWTPAGIIIAYRPKAE